MKKWTNCLLTFAGAIMLFQGQASAGDDCCNPCIPCSSSSCFIDDFNVAIDILWWKPCIDELTYATECFEDGDKTTIKYKSVCPEWEPGVRVIFGRPSFYCDWGFVASYTYFHSDDRSSIEKDSKISSPLLHQSFTSDKGGLCDDAKAKWDLTYQELDALLTYDMSCCNPCHLFQPFAGVAALWLCQEFEVVLTAGSSTDTVEWDSDFWGVGLRAGIEYQYLFSRCLRFFTVVHGTLLAGYPDNDWEQIYDTELCVLDDDCCLLVPGYHIGLGLIYDTCLCNVDISFRLGYEFTAWQNLPNHRIFVGDDKTIEGGHATSSNIRTLGMHGLLFGAGVTF